MSKESWKTELLGELASAVTSGVTPQSGSAKYYAPAGIPFIKIDDLTASSGRTVSDSFLHVTTAALRETGLKVYPSGTILVSMYGTVGLVKVTNGKAVANQAIAALVPPFKCDPDFLYHYLVWSRPRWDRFKAQTTQANINGAIVKRLEVRLPEVCEQRRIAEILDILDDQIRSTALIIQKLRTTRIAFVSTLLRVDGNGTWRGDWPLRPMRSVVTGIDAGKSPDCPDLPASSGEWGVLKVSAVGNDSFRPSENKKIPLSICVDARSAVRLGDLLMTRANTPDLVGMACVVDRSFDSQLVLSDKTWRINPSARLDRDFLVEVLRALPSRRYIQNLATGTSGSMKNFSQRALLDMLIPVPELIEQRRSSARLGALTARVAAEQAALDKLKATKAGLVSDLLAGRVRMQPEPAS